MKVQAQTPALQEALTLAGSIVATRTPKPVLQCVKMVAAEDTLTLMATDLEVGCRYELTAVQVSEDGEALLPANRLGGIVREAGDESLSIETDKDASHVKEPSGSHFKIFGYDPAEYPAVAEFTGEADFSIPAAVLSDMIGKTLFATAKAHSHYAISGVLWEASGKKLQLVATDGHRMAQARGNLTGPAASDVTAIVPGKLMQLIQRTCGEVDGDIEIKIEENQILARAEGITLVSSLVQGNFPKYSDVIPKETTRKATIVRSEFEHRVRQAALLTTEESRSIRLSFADGKLTLSSRAPETGEAEVACAAEYDGEPMELGINPQFLTDAMRVISEDSITIEMNQPNKPVIVKAGGEFLYVFMPVDLG
jgi:DNA polymerase-3 subunit beta